MHFLWVKQCLCLMFLCSVHALLESVMYKMGVFSGMVYSPMMKPRASAIFMQVCPVPHWLGSRHDRVSIGLAGRWCHSDSVSFGRISGIMMLMLLTAHPSFKLASMLIKTGRSILLVASSISEYVAILLSLLGLYPIVGHHDQHLRPPNIVFFWGVVTLAHCSPSLIYVWMV